MYRLSHAIFTSVASPCQTLCKLAGDNEHTTISGTAHAQFAEGLNFYLLCSAYERVLDVNDPSALLFMVLLEFDDG